MLIGIRPSDINVLLNWLISRYFDYHLLVNTHGTTPRGWHRTWPNLMTMEAVKGFEFITFEQINADMEASHSAMLPFTRNVFSTLDFTPMSLIR